MLLLSGLVDGLLLLDSSTIYLDAIIESIADIHASCILRDNTMATFLPPLSREGMIKHWKDLVVQCDGNTRFIFVILASKRSRTCKEQIPAPFKGHEWLDLPARDDGAYSTALEVAGVVSLSMPQSETGPFRGLVQKLFVSPMHRRKGVATELVAALEERALALGKWSLMLDTTKGTPAEFIYPKLQYKLLGTVEAYGYSPADGALVDELFFWKDLRKRK